MTCQILSIEKISWLLQFCKHDVVDALQIIKLLLFGFTDLDTLRCIINVPIGSSSLFIFLSKSIEYLVLRLLGKIQSLSSSNCKRVTSNLTLFKHFISLVFGSGLSVFLGIVVDTDSRDMKQSNGFRLLNLNINDQVEFSLRKTLLLLLFFLLLKPLLLSFILRSFNHRRGHLTVLRRSLLLLVNLSRGF